MHALIALPAEEPELASLTIRNLNEETRRRLRLRAARHGRSMEAEARAVLDSAVAAEEPVNLGTQIHELLAEFEGELDDLIPPRTAPPRAAELYIDDPVT